MKIRSSKFNSSTGKSLPKVQTGLDLVKAYKQVKLKFYGLLVYSTYCMYAGTSCEHIYTHMNVQLIISFFRCYHYAYHHYHCSTFHPTPFLIDFLFHPTQQSTPCTWVLLRATVP